jgi:hypothetical protein
MDMKTKILKLLYENRKSEEPLYAYEISMMTGIPANLALAILENEFQSNKENILWYKICQDFKTIDESIKYKGVDFHIKIDISGITSGWVISDFGILKFEHDVLKYPTIF